MTAPKSTKHQITEQLPVNFTPADWNKLFLKSLNAYKSAIWQMIAVIELGSTKFGRDRMVEMTPFDEAKINTFNKLGRLKIPTVSDILPEIAYELIPLSNKPVREQKKWYNKAKDNSAGGMKPKQLRKMIRASLVTVPSIKNSATKNKSSLNVPSWPRHALLLETEYNKLNAEERERAKVILKHQLQCLM